MAPLAMGYSLRMIVYFFVEFDGREAPTRAPRAQKRIGKKSCSFFFSFLSNIYNTVDVLEGAEKRSHGDGRSKPIKSVPGFRW